MKSYVMNATSKRKLMAPYRVVTSPKTQTSSQPKKRYLHIITGLLYYWTPYMLDFQIWSPLFRILKPHLPPPPWGKFTSL